MIRCPDGLSDPAREHWAQVVPELERQGKVTDADVGQLFAMCEAFALVQKLAGLIAKNGVLAPGKAKGEVVESPYVKMYLQAWARYEQAHKAFDARAPKTASALPGPPLALPAGDEPEEPRHVVVELVEDGPVDNDPLGHDDLEEYMARVWARRPAA